MDELLEQLIKSYVDTKSDSDRFADLFKYCQRILHSNFAIDDNPSIDTLLRMHPHHLDDQSKTTV